jgi:quinol monooxygenase YgiN
MKENHYSLVVTFKAKTGQANALKTALTTMVKASQQETGCLQYDLHESIATPGVFLIYETWESKAAHALHDRSWHIKKWRTQEASLIEEKPTVSFWKPL